MLCLVEKDLGWNSSGTDSLREDLESKRRRKEYSSARLQLRLLLFGFVGMAHIDANVITSMSRRLARAIPRYTGGLVSGTNILASIAAANALNNLVLRRFPNR